jgi:quinol monooxygenase YgiN
MSEIAYVVKITTAEGKRSDALAVFAKLVAATEDEPGTLQYDLSEDTTDANVLWFYERYADQAAFEAHIGSAAMAETMGALGGLLDGMPDMRQVALVERKGGA